MPKTTTQDRPGAPKGNQNAAKPPDKRRIPVYVYLHPDTVRLLSQIDKSRGKAIDDAVRAAYGTEDNHE